MISNLFSYFIFCFFLFSCTEIKNEQTHSGKKGGFMNINKYTERINEFQEKHMWSKQHKGLACRLVCNKQEVKPGETFSFEFKLKNIGNKIIIIPLFFFDEKRQTLVVDSEEAVGSTGTYLLIRSDLHSNLVFDNFGYHSFMPDVSYIKIVPGEILSTNIAIDDSSTFIIKKGKNIELFGGKDHCGLTIEGTFFFKVELNIAKSEKEHWHGRMETNEISIIVKK